MSKDNEIPKTFNPAECEGKIYDAWEKNGCFKAGKKAGQKPFVIMMPPANANASLHLGNALGITLQDIMVRYHRMKGDPTLYQPGTDHAGIQTQVVHERELEKQGKTRQDLGREEFMKQTLAFTKKNSQNIIGQTKKMGISCDWSRLKFTLDPDLSKVVLETFVKMYEDGLIYKGKRIINWCPRCATGLSDIEVKHVDEQATLWYIKYPLAENPKKFITVATSRPETMLGDTAVAVNPKDKRFKDLVGKTAVLPLMNREIPIIADKEVDPKFGTGAVKVTPAHDPADFAMGERHKLEIVSVIGEDNKMTKKAGRYSGLDIPEAREKIIKDLEKKDLLEKTEKYTAPLSQCERCDTTIQPLISKQWFIKMKSLADEAIKMVKSGQIKIIPQRFEKDLYRFLEDIQDWNISRQIWWGHQMPVWYCLGCRNPESGTRNQEPEDRNREQGVVVSVERPKKCPKCGGTKFKQEEDVLDTWFSSAQWTFSTLGGPGAKDFKYYHPTSVMETGWDILFFWVARMMMVTKYATGQIPFRNVYLHGLITDRNGKKMSKSRGNVIDPLQMIAKYGADALRLSFVLGVAAGQNNSLYEEKIAGFRNFTNKLWNIARFIKTAKPPDKIDQSKEEQLKLADQWIQNSLSRLALSVTDNMEAFEFSQAGQALFDFVWHDLADWYLEAAKWQLTPARVELLEKIMKQILGLLHPFIPYITEVIWADQKNPLIVTPWPKAEKAKLNNAAAKKFGLIQQAVTAIRRAKNRLKMSPGQRAAVVIKGPQGLLVNLNLIGFLAVAETEGRKAANLSVAFVDAKLQAASRETLYKEISEKERLITRQEKKLANKNFTRKAPAEIVAKEKEKLVNLKRQLAELKKEK